MFPPHRIVQLCTVIRRYAQSDHLFGGCMHRYPALRNELLGILPVTTKQEWRKMVENEFAKLEILFRIEWKEYFYYVYGKVGV